MFDVNEYRLICEKLGKLYSNREGIDLEIERTLARCAEMERELEPPRRGNGDAEFSAAIPPGFIPPPQRPAAPPQQAPLMPPPAQPAPQKKERHPDRKATIKMAAFLRQYLRSHASCDRQIIANAFNITPGAAAQRLSRMKDRQAEVGIAFRIERPNFTIFKA